MMNGIHHNFKTRLQNHLMEREGNKAVNIFVHYDPDQHYSRMFNEAMVNVHEKYVIEAYSKPQVVLARDIDRGTILNMTSLITRTSAVMILTALHYRCLSDQLNRPRTTLPGRPVDEFGNTVTVPVFVQYEIQEKLIGANREPSESMELDEIRKKLLRKTRSWERRMFQAYRWAKWYVYEHGTTYGMFRFVARLARLDENRRIIGFRRPTEQHLSESGIDIIRQVRQLYFEADRRMKQD